MNVFRSLCIATLALACCGIVNAQSWTPLNHAPGAAVGVMLQLRDGRILVHEPSSRNWLILTPDSAGSYVNGTWSSGGALPSTYAPLYFSSQVLFGSGKNVLVEGGEYNFGSAVWTTLGALGSCTPFGSCTWASNAPPTGWSTI